MIDLEGIKAALASKQAAGPGVPTDQEAHLDWLENNERYVTDLIAEVERLRASGHVVWTRYEPSPGRVVRHAFGPYPESQAQTERRRMLREAEERGVRDKVEISAIRFYDDRETE